MPKNFVCLDLTMGDYVDYWKQEFRFLQTAKRVRNMFYKIHREVIEENVKGDFGSLLGHLVKKPGFWVTVKPFS